MVKSALLIGVSNYQFSDTFSSLNSPIKDIDALANILDNREIGEFDNVEKLSDPSSQEIIAAVEIFFSGSKKDDLLLFYFSGHGVIDNHDGSFYFTGVDTNKDRLLSTAIEAERIHRIMQRSRSRQQVIILDCCHSGGFAKSMRAKSGPVDVTSQFGGSGRAVLTSSNSTKRSFEKDEYELSVYTHYLVEALESGEADKENTGWLTVHDLNKYVSDKVRMAVPGSEPQFYPVLLHEQVKERAVAGAVVKLVFDPNSVRLGNLNHAVKRGTLKQQFSGLVVELARA